MPLWIDDRLVDDVAARLRDGDLRFSARQLYYAACAAAERPEVSVGNSQIVGGALLTVASAVIAFFTTVYLIFLVILGAVLLGQGVQNRRRERGRPRTRPLALSYDEFVQRFVEPRRGAGRAPEGLVDAGTEPSTATGTRDDAVLVVCDRAETAALLRANRGALPPHVEVVGEDEVPPPLQGRRVHALHDADPQGCALPLRLHAAGAAEVVDLGLRPADVMHHRVQVIEGAPALVPPDVAALLIPDELIWLADGRRAELAILTPRQLVDGVAAALAATPVSPPARLGAVPGGVHLAGTRLLVPAPG